MCAYAQAILLLGFGGFSRVFSRFSSFFFCFSAFFAALASCFFRFSSAASSSDLGGFGFPGSTWNWISPSTALTVTPFSS